ncbi:Coiled-coil domain-containing protein 81 [Bulinus truncatus]|nr:Coiled-coil domain-containing protein 81 [Bulinus truncatus]
MTEATQEILASVLNGRYSSIKGVISEDDVSNIWENVSGYIEKQLCQQKGVQLPGLGIFAISQKQLEVGNNKFIITRRPVFNISEKFAQTHGLQFQKYFVQGSVPVLPLNFSSISFESPFDRDTVERCVKDIIHGVSRALAVKRNVELRFTGIGRLTVRDGKVKMKFYKEFISELDSTGKLVDSMMNRPGTVDSVMSDRMSTRPVSSSTVILPKIHAAHDGNHTGNLSPVLEEEPAHHVSFTEYQAGSEEQHFNNETEHGVKFKDSDFINHGDMLNNDFSAGAGVENSIEDDEKLNAFEQVLPPHPPLDEDIMQDDNLRLLSGGKYSSRLALPLAKASGISFADELTVPHPSPKMFNPSRNVRLSVNGDENALKPPTPPRLSPMYRSHSFDHIQSPKTFAKVPTPPGSSCGHRSAGQELCYLCHQRARMNVPVSFAEEKKKREAEEERLLLQYNALKDAEETLKVQEKQWARRYDLQKISAFNLGVAEAIQAKLKAKDAEPQRAYLFSRRPLTPCRVPKQDEYLKDLDKQVESKSKSEQKKKADEEFLERLEQVQLAEDLAAQREQYLKNKSESTETYKKALEAQLKYKPLPMPEKEPDTEIFGKNDMNNEKMEERRQRAYVISQEQKAVVEQKKRDAILSKLTEQKVEEEVLARARNDLRDERAFKHLIHSESRKHLEKDWQKSLEARRARELEEHFHSLSPGILLHEQCDRYSHCRQCKRRMNNCGETNIWTNIVGVTLFKYMYMKSLAGDTQKSQVWETLA